MNDKKDSCGFVLPDWIECNVKCSRGDANPLEVFINNNQPSSDCMSEIFRDELREAIEYILESLRPDEEKEQPEESGRSLEEGFRKGQKVYVDFQEGEDDENWTGLGEFIQYVPLEVGYGYLKEPHAKVKTSEDDVGSVFPVRCLSVLPE